jgi:quercetin dioxygenase-like cupin family protein
MIRYFLPIVIAFAARAVAAQDFRPEIENHWVRVFRVKQSPHELAPRHEHAASLVVCLTDLNEKITGSDGAAREVTRKAGEVLYMDAGQYAAENVSDRPLEAVLIELKSARINAAPVALDPVKLDPQYHAVIFENERVRVLRTTLEPHVKSPMHQHPSYVVVYLTELHTTMKLGDGRIVDNPREPGEIAWRDPLQHETENIGDHTAVEIQVELK